VTIAQDVKLLLPTKPLKKTLGYLATGIGGGLAAAASTVAVLGYKGPTSFPIIHGINIAVCAPTSEGTSSLAEQRRFLDELEKHKRQLVFIADLTIYGLGCWDTSSSKKPPERVRQGYGNEDFDFIDNTLVGDNLAEIKGGALTIGLKKVAAGAPGVWLIVGAPQNENYLVDIGCGENCFAAHGLYKTTFNAAEGYTIYRLDPFPATSAVIDAYQCTLNKFGAGNWWQNFSACRF
jgi:hypothetical protein